MVNRFLIFESRLIQANQLGLERASEVARSWLLGAIFVAPFFGGLRRKSLFFPKQFSKIFWIVKCVCSSKQLSFLATMKVVLIICLLLLNLHTAVFAQDYGQYARGAGAIRRRNNR